MISVIIPTLNEESELPRTLAALHDSYTSREIVVVDAGSTDRTLSVARAAGCRVIAAPAPHRARQLNLGAQSSQANILLFLHADTRLNSDSLQQIERALRSSKTVGGAFARRFENPSITLRTSARLADFRSRWLGWYFGDQAIFARRCVFEELGGFAELRLFEDLDFSRRLAQRGQVVTLQPPIISSGRRFSRQGPLPTTVADFWLTCRYLLGADPDRLDRAQARRR